MSCPECEAKDRQIALLRQRWADQKVVIERVQELTHRALTSWPEPQKPAAGDRP